MIGRVADSTDAQSAGRVSQRGDPSWEIAYFFPRQGDWTEQDFLAFEASNFPIELVDGCLEFLPMPTYLHQRLVRYLFLQLDRAAQSTRRGQASFAPCPIRLWEGRFREPDLFFLSSARVARREDPPQGAEIVVEVLSQGQPNRDRDLINKRIDYAKAQIPEYWIVDPEQATVTVLTLNGSEYAVHGEFNRGMTATSIYLPEFTANVEELFQSATVS
jgi:Uma2 family endonuclease